MAVDVFKDMNPRQREAIAQIEGPLSVIAGAGSGKTRVITHRIANIIQQGTRPDRILAITFTNKAAGEMQDRVERLLGLKTPWITTFHSAGLRMLKLEQDRLGFEHPFTILDVDDQQRLFKRLIKELDLDPADHSPKALQWQVSVWKNRLLIPEKVTGTNVAEDVNLAIYRRYRDVCREECVLDFDDLLMVPVLLLRDDEELRHKYQERFPYILIDEYQDTNPAQYALIKLLGEHRNVCATGDPDQAIYGWRGADVQNILDFEHDFPNCRTVLLEQNYRSTKVILQAAQAVVEHNVNRKDKTIFTENEEGEPIVLITVDDQDDEAMAVAAAVDRFRKDGHRLSDMAVFYRTNAQSRTLEEWLIRREVPYRIVGGTRFYDRREVKDLLAYCKLLVNPRDLVSLQRIVNVPKRGIGEKTWNKVRDLAYDEGVSVFEVLMTEHLIDRVAVGRSSRPLREFAALMRRLAALDLQDAGACLRAILDLTGLEDHYLTEDEERGLERVANLRETVTAAEQFQGVGSVGGLEGFLDHISLITSVDEQVDDQEQLVLMTLHASKGLEFPVVFIVGCEQGVLPLVRQGQPCDYEEERRLMYVGITRAMTRLYISRAVTRTQFGRTVRNPPSMFLAEIPDACIAHYDRAHQRERHRATAVDDGPHYPKSSRARQVAQAPYQAPASVEDALAGGQLISGSALKSAIDSGRSSAGLQDVPTSFEPGDRVVHASFGPGAIVTVTGADDDPVLVVDFDREGTKELLQRYAAARMRVIDQ